MIFFMLKAVVFHQSFGGITARSHSFMNLWEAGDTGIPITLSLYMPKRSCIRKVWKRILLMKSRIISIWREKQVSNMVTNTGATIWCLLSIWRIDKFQFVKETDMNNSMETKYYIVARIDGDYAWLNRTDAEEEPLFIARALLPEEIDEGTKLKYEMLQYEIL